MVENLRTMTPANLVVWSRWLLERDRLWARRGVRRCASGKSSPGAMKRTQASSV